MATETQAWASSGEDMAIHLPDIRLHCRAGLLQRNFYLSNTTGFLFDRISAGPGSGPTLPRQTYWRFAGLLQISKKWN
jgi:hypothetical protein